MILVLKKTIGQGKNPRVPWITWMIGEERKSLIVESQLISGEGKRIRK